MIKAITKPAGITTQTGTATVRGELITVTTYSGISLSLFALPEDGKLMQIKRLFAPFFSSLPSSTSVYRSFGMTVTACSPLHKSSDVFRVYSTPSCGLKGLR